VRTVAISPHLDDAALSASAILGARGATVLTVFTALPAADMPATWWDRLTGATSSRARQHERLAEDRAAMRLLGAHGVHLDELEALYRDADPDLGRATERMTDVLAAADQVWLPAAIGGHPDHVLARDAGLRAAATAGHASVVLYADFPYVITYGWPFWVTEKSSDPYLDAAYWLTDQLEAAGLNPAALVPTVTRLSPGQRSAKAEIIAAYRSQAPALRLAPHDLARDPAKLDYELSWRLSMS
jgi:LmbE family N-acetylglucosaminyl deacetylase